MDCCRSFFRPFILNLKRPIGPRGLRALRSEFQQAWWISAMLPTFLILNPFCFCSGFPRSDFPSPQAAGASARIPCAFCALVPADLSGSMRRIDDRIDSHHLAPLCHLAGAWTMYLHFL